MALSVEERKARKAMSLKAWRQRNRERVRADKRLYYRRHRERINAAHKEKLRDPEEKRKRTERYGKWKTTPEGKRSIRAANKRWIRKPENAEKMAEYHRQKTREYYQQNRELIRAKASAPAARREATEKQRLRRQRERLINPPEPKPTPEERKELIRERDRIRYWRDRETILARCRANKAKAAAYARMRSQRDPMFRIVKNLRSRIRSAFLVSKGSKSTATLELLGCTPDYFRSHLARKFRDGMTFENYGKWHIDHIVPCAAFSLEHEDQQRLCFNFSNLQPLWARENQRKKARLDWAA